MLLKPWLYLVSLFYLVIIVLFFAFIRDKLTSYENTITRYELSIFRRS